MSDSSVQLLDQYIQLCRAGEDATAPRVYVSANATRLPAWVTAPLPASMPVHRSASDSGTLYTIHEHQATLVAAPHSSVQARSQSQSKTASSNSSLARLKALRMSASVPAQSTRPMQATGSSNSILDAAFYAPAPQYPGPIAMLASQLSATSAHVGNTHLSGADSTSSADGPMPHRLRPSASHANKHSLRRAHRSVTPDAQRRASTPTPTAAPPRSNSPMQHPHPTTSHAWAHTPLHAPPGHPAAWVPQPNAATEVAAQPEWAQQGNPLQPHTAAPARQPSPLHITARQASPGRIVKVHGAPRHTTRSPLLRTHVTRTPTPSRQHPSTPPPRQPQQQTPPPAQHAAHTQHLHSIATAQSLHPAALGTPGTPLHSLLLDALDVITHDPPPYPDTRTSVTSHTQPSAPAHHHLPAHSQLALAMASSRASSQRQVTSHSTSAALHTPTQVYGQQGTLMHPVAGEVRGLVSQSVDSASLWHSHQHQPQHQLQPDLAHHLQQLPLPQFPSQHHQPLPRQHDWAHSHMQRPGHWQDTRPDRAQQASAAAAQGPGLPAQRAQAMLGSHQDMLGRTAAPEPHYILWPPSQDSATASIRQSWPQPHQQQSQPAPPHMQPQPMHPAHSFWPTLPQGQAPEQHATGRSGVVHLHPGAAAQWQLGAQQPLLVQQPQQQQQQQPAVPQPQQQQQPQQPVNDAFTDLLHQQALCVAVFSGWRAVTRDAALWRLGVCKAVLRSQRRGTLRRCVRAWRDVTREHSAALSLAQCVIEPWSERVRRRVMRAWHQQACAHQVLPVWMEEVMARHRRRACLRAWWEWVQDRGSVRAAALERLTYAWDRVWQWEALQGWRRAAQHGQAARLSRRMADMYNSYRMQRTALTAWIQRWCLACAVEEVKARRRLVVKAMVFRALQQHVAQAWQVPEELHVFRSHCLMRYAWSVLEQCVFHARSSQWRSMRRYRHSLLHRALQAWLLALDDRYRRMELAAACHQERTLKQCLTAWRDAAHSMHPLPDLAQHPQATPSYLVHAHTESQEDASHGRAQTLTLNSWMEESQHIPHGHPQLHPQHVEHQSHPQPQNQSQVSLEQLLTERDHREVQHSAATSHRAGPEECAASPNTAALAAASSAVAAALQSAQLALAATAANSAESPDAAYRARPHSSSGRSAHTRRSSDTNVSSLSDTAQTHSAGRSSVTGAADKPSDSSTGSLSAASTSPGAARAVVQRALGLLQRPSSAPQPLLSDAPAGQHQQYGGTEGGAQLWRPDVRSQASATQRRSAVVGSSAGRPTEGTSSSVVSSDGVEGDQEWGVRGLRKTQSALGSSTPAGSSTPRSPEVSAIPSITALRDLLGLPDEAAPRRGPGRSGMSTPPATPVLPAAAGAADGGAAAADSLHLLQPQQLLQLLEADVQWFDGMLSEGGPLAAGGGESPARGGPGRLLGTGSRSQSRRASHHLTGTDTGSSTPVRQCSTPTQHATHQSVDDTQLALSRQEGKGHTATQPPAAAPAWGRLQAVELPLSSSWVEDATSEDDGEESVRRHGEDPATPTSHGRITTEAGTRDASPLSSAASCVEEEDVGPVHHAAWHVRVPSSMVHARDVPHTAQEWLPSAYAGRQSEEEWVGGWGGGRRQDDGRPGGRRVSGSVLGYDQVPGAAKPERSYAERAQGSSRPRAASAPVRRAAEGRAGGQGAQEQQEGEALSYRQQVAAQHARQASQPPRPPGAASGGGGAVGKRAPGSAAAQAGSSAAVAGASTGSKPRRKPSPFMQRMEAAVRGNQAASQEAWVRQPQLHTHHPVGSTHDDPSPVTQQGEGDCEAVYLSDFLLDGGASEVSVVSDEAGYRSYQVQPKSITKVKSGAVGAHHDQRHLTPTGSRPANSRPASVPDVAWTQHAGAEVPDGDGWMAGVDGNRRMGHSQQRLEQLLPDDVLQLGQLGAGLARAGQLVPRASQPQQLHAGKSGAGAPVFHDNPVYRAQRHHHPGSSDAVLAHAVPGRPGKLTASALRQGLACSGAGFGVHRTTETESDAWSEVDGSAVGVGAVPAWGVRKNPLYSGGGGL